MLDHSPHTTLLALHQPVDAALLPYFEPMGLECTTESINTVLPQQIAALRTSTEDPMTALVTFGEHIPTPGLVIAEPALCSAVLGGMWRAERQRDARVTNVEQEILRQHLADVVGAWSRAWRSEGTRIFPRLAMAATLSTLPTTLPNGTWYIARTIVLNDQDQAVGVLLFCYPEAIIDALQAERDRIRWRSRIARGLSAAERERIRSKAAGPLKHVVMPVRTSMTLQVPIGLINNLERGDVIDLDTAVGGSTRLSMLSRDVVGTFVRVGTNLAIAVNDLPAASDDTTSASNTADFDLPQQQTA